MNKVNTLIPLVLMLVVLTALAVACAGTPTVQSATSLPKPTAAPTVAPTATPTSTLANAPVEFVWRVKGDVSKGTRLSRPSGLAFDKQDNLYVLDGRNSQIQKLDRDGNFLLRWGSEGNGEGQFAFRTGNGHPGAIAVDAQGMVHVADANGYVQVFDGQGKFVRKWGNGLGDGDGQFLWPGCMAFDHQGNLYLADWGNPYIADGTQKTSRVEKFDAQGKFLLKWRPATGDVYCLAVDPQGNVYTVNAAENQIEKYDSQGHFITKWGGKGNSEGQFADLEGIAVDAQGNVYASDNLNNYRVEKFDSNGKFLGQWGGWGTGDGQFDHNWRIAIDSQNNIYVTDDGINDSIQKFRPSALTVAAPPAAAPAAATQLEKVTIGCEAPVPFLLFLPCDVAQALGLFKQEGLDVTDESMGRADAYNALANGSVDFSAYGIDLPIAAQGTGKEMQMVIEFERFPAFILLVDSALKDKIKTVADLKGKTIVGPGGVPGLFLYVTAQAGLKPEDVTLTSGGDGVQITGQMQRGVLDAAVTGEPYTTQLVKSGAAYPLVDLATEADSTKWLGGEYPEFSLVTTTEMTQKHPQTVQKVTNALVKALHYIATHSAADIAAILPDSVTGKDRALYIAALEHMLPAFSKDGLVSASGVKNAVAIDKALGAIKPDAQINISALYTNDFVNSVK